MEIYQAIVVAIVFGALAGCANPPKTTIIVAPEVVPYSNTVQKRAAEEMTGMGPACPRDNVFGGCSAVKRFILDYGHMRNQSRELRK